VGENICVQYVGCTWQNWLQWKIRLMLVLACRYYLLSLKHGVQHSLQVFRLTSLWLENPTRKEVCEVMEQHLDHIPSYKFLPVLPQLAPRISTSTSEPFATKLNELLGKYSKIVCEMYKSCFNHMFNYSNNPGDGLFPVLSLSLRAEKCCSSPQNPSLFWYLWIFSVTSVLLL